MPKLEGVYQDRNGRWYFKASVGADPLTGKRSQVTRRGFDTALAASRARRRFIDDQERRPVSSAAVVMTVNELLDWYLDAADAEGRLSAKTRFDYRKNADVYVRPWLGGRRARDVTPESIVLWQRELAARGGAKKHGPLAANTIRLARAPLAAAFRRAVATGLLASNPVRSAPAPRPSRGVAPHWTPAQAKSFLDSRRDDPLFACWVLLLSTGLRIGEMAWLRWVNVDLAGRRLRVIEFVSTLGYAVVPSRGKSRTATRTVDLDDTVVATLTAHAQRQRTALGFEPEFVFANRKGDPFHPQTLSKRLAVLSTRAGLPRLTAHGLRHTSATLLLDAGVPPKVAAERLGHADPMLFLNLYGHVTPTMQRDAADRVGRALLGPGKGAVA